MIKKILTLSILLVSGTVWGQAITTPINNWTYQNHASTIGEGYLNGQARMIQAAGQTNYLNSIAAVNYQEARSKWIDNNKKLVTTYYETRIYNKEIKDRYARRTPTREQWDKIISSALPEALTNNQYDRTSGKLTWPHILRTAEYDAFRNRIDELILARSAENDGDGSPFQREVSSLIDAMKMLLRSNMYSVTDNQYADARAYLTSLDYEVKQNRNTVPVTTDPATTAPINASASVN